MSESPAQDPSAPDYRRRVLSSLAWQGSAQFLGRALSWAASIVVIRLLDPSDYGIMAMATVFLSFLLLLSDVGIGAAIVQAREIRDEDARSIQGFVLIFTGLGFALTFLGSPLVAAFFDEPRLVPVLRVLSVCFLFMSTYLVPEAFLMRHLRYDQKSKVDFAALAASALASVGCAFAGMGVWALVAGSVATFAAKALGFNLVGPGLVRPQLSFARSAPLLSFGSLIVVDRIVWFLYANADVTIAGKLLGKELLGLYSVTLTLAAIPLDKIVPVFTNVSFSAFSRIQDERERVRRNLLRAIQYASIFFFPVFWGMALVAPVGIPLLVGEKWAPIVVPFQMICAILPLKALGALLPPALFGIGRPKVNIVNMVICLGVMGAAFLVAVRWEVRGMALAWLAVYPVVFAVTTARALRALEVPLAGFARCLRTAVLASLAMVGGVWGLGAALAGALPELASLAASIAVGAALYLGAVWIADRGAIAELRGLLGR